MTMTAQSGGAEAVLCDPELDARLRSEALVTVPLLDAAAVAELTEAFWARAPQGERGIRLDYLRSDRDLVASMADVFAPVWERAIPGVLADHVPVYSSFVIKYPDDESALYLHRDLPVEDERDGIALSMWMPLTDTGPELDNGPIAFVPGSQHIAHGGFGPNAAVLFNPYRDHLEGLLEPLTVAAGTAVIYDARMLHASAPNRSSNPRLAVGCLLARRDRPLVQVVATGRRHRRVHHVDRRYFIDHPPSELAAHGMPAGYPVVDEYDEDPAVTPATVLGPLVGAQPLARQIDIPLDLVHDIVSVEPVPVLPDLRAPEQRHDLRIAAADLDPVGPVLGGVLVEATTGACGARDLVRGWRRRAPLPDAVPDPIVSLAPPRVRHASLAVIDPGGRLVLRSVGRGLLRREIAVVEATPVRAGICTPTHAGELGLSGHLELPDDRAVTIFNEGPGPLVLIIRTVVAPRSRAARSAASESWTHPGAAATLAACASDMPTRPVGATGD